MSKWILYSSSHTDSTHKLCFEDWAAECSKKTQKEYSSHPFRNNSAIWFDAQSDSSALVWSFRREISNNEIIRKYMVLAVYKMHIPKLSKDYLSRVSFFVRPPVPTRAMDVHAWHSLISTRDLPRQLFRPASERTLCATWRFFGYFLSRAAREVPFWTRTVVAPHSIHNHTSDVCRNKSAHSGQQMILINLLFATENAIVPRVVNLIRFAARRGFIMIPYCCCARTANTHTHIFNNNYFVCFELWMCGAYPNPYPYPYVRAMPTMPQYVMMWMELSLVIRRNKWNAWIYVHFNV